MASVKRQRLLAPAKSNIASSASADLHWYLELTQSLPTSVLAKTLQQLLHDEDTRQQTQSALKEATSSQGYGDLKAQVPKICSKPVFQVCCCSKAVWYSRVLHLPDNRRGTSWSKLSHPKNQLITKWADFGTEIASLTLCSVKHNIG